MPLALPLSRPLLRRRLAHGLLSMLMVVGAGCGEKSSEADTAVDTGDERPESSGETCGVVELRPDGPPAPVVGDHWNLLLYCDDALLTGASTFRSDPADTVTFDEYVATFLVAGEVTITMQVGRYRDDVTVTVGEP